MGIQREDVYIVCGGGVTCRDFCSVGIFRNEPDVKYYLRGWFKGYAITSKDTHESWDHTGKPARIE